MFKYEINLKRIVDDQVEANKNTSDKKGWKCEQVN